MRIFFPLIVFVFLFFRQNFAQEYKYWETYGQYVPLVSVGILGVVSAIEREKSHNNSSSEMNMESANAKSNRTLVHRAMQMGVALVSEGLLVKTLKYTVDEERPDGSAHNSFPSGHTATAFNGAELVRYECGNWWGLGAYMLASAVGVSRVIHERHYIWDVGAGAVLGVLSARVGIQTVTKIHERCALKHGAQVSLYPSFSSQRASLTCIMSF